MSAAAAARERSLAAIKIDHAVVSFVNEPVCRPCVVLVLAELEANEVAAAFRTGKNIHVSLIALIDPALSRKLSLTFRTLDAGEFFVGKSIGLRNVAGENNVLDRIGCVVIGLITSCACAEHTRCFVILGKSKLHIKF